MKETFTRVVLGDQVKEYIIDAIINGEYQPGDRVVASTVSRQLGVSQAPVREAIRDLVMLGFLETEPFKGPSVRSFSRKELCEVYAVRASLEALAARLAASRLTPDDVESLQGMLEKMICAAEEQDAEEMIRLDNEFHATILRISDNSLLNQIWQTLQFGYWTIVTTRRSEYNLEELARRHEDLLVALRTGDPQKAAVAMQRHIEDLGRPIGDPGEVLDCVGDD